MQKSKFNIFFFGLVVLCSSACNKDFITTHQQDTLTFARYIQNSHLSSTTRNKCSLAVDKEKSQYSLLLYTDKDDQFQPFDFYIFDDKGNHLGSTTGVAAHSSNIIGTNYTFFHNARILSIYSGLNSETINAQKYRYDEVRDTIAYDEEKTIEYNVKKAISKIEDLAYIFALDAFEDRIGAAFLDKEGFLSFALYDFNTLDKIDSFNTNVQLEAKSVTLCIRYAPAYGNFVAAILPTEGSGTTIKPSFFIFGSDTLIQHIDGLRRTWKTPIMAIVNRSIYVSNNGGIFTLYKISQNSDGDWSLQEDEVDDTYDIKYTIGMEMLTENPERLIIAGYSSTQEDGYQTIAYEEGKGYSKICSMGYTVGVGDNNDKDGAFIKTPDGGFLLAGKVTVNGKVFAGLFKLDKDGCLIGE